MKAGEKLNLQVEAFWDKRDLVPHDFSIVVWSDGDKPVNMTGVYHNQNGHSSQSFPNY